MLPKARLAARPLLRAFSTAASKIEKVTVLGASGGIGQPLSLQLKQAAEIKHLSLYDVVPLNKGVGIDLSHCDTPTKVDAFVGDELESALKGASVVIIPAGVPRKPGMTRDDLFNVNANIVGNLVKAAARTCPEAFVLVITNPVNSTVPIAATIRKRMRLSNEKLIGVTTLDIIRANNFVADYLKQDVGSVNVTVIGGHAGATIIPILSPFSKHLNKEARDVLTKKVATAGDEVVKAKAGSGSATLSMAFAATKFSKSLFCAMNGAKDITECAFVESALCPHVPFFASPVVLGPKGCVKPTAPPPMDEAEKDLVNAALPQLKAEVEKGIAFGEKFQL